MDKNEFDLKKEMLNFFNFFLNFSNGMFHAQISLERYHILIKVLYNGVCPPNY